MYLFFAIFPFFASLIQLADAEKTLVIAFGPVKNANLELSDVGYMNLNIAEYVYNWTKPPIAENVEIEKVPVNCTLDFEWVPLLYERLGMDESNPDAATPDLTYDNILHVGPLCEYYGLEASQNEATDYVTLIQNVYLKAKEKNLTNFFATPSFTVSLLEKDVGIENATEQLARKYDVPIPESEAPYFVPLSGTVKQFAAIVYQYVNFHLSKYAALLSPVKQLASHVDVFCRHFTEELMRLSGENYTFFVRYHYIGEQSEDDFLEIWNQVLQRSRYVLYCGDVSLFVQWLEAGRNLWEPHKLTDFGIFYVEFGVDETNEYNFGQLKRSVDELFKRIPEAVHNVKFLSLDSPVPCGRENKTAVFCDKFSATIRDLTAFNYSSSPFSSQVRYERKVFFYSLSLFNLFNALFKDEKKFWTTVKTLNNMNNILALAPLKVSIYDFEPSSVGTKMTRSCELPIDTTMITTCDLNWNGPAPKRAPGQCGYMPCVKEVAPPWKYVIIIVVCIISSGVVIGVSSVYGYLKYRRKQEWSVAPLGDVRLKIENIKPLKSAELIAKVDIVRHGKGSKTEKSQIDKRNHIFLDPVNMDAVLGTFCNTCILVKPFKALTFNESPVRDAVAKLRDLSKENVAKIHGYVVQNVPALYGLVMETGDHGTLHNLLYLDELDLTLKLPLLADLFRGLKHIHETKSLNYHGNLTSRCCVVDSHFVLKIQLSEFPELNKLALAANKTPERDDANRIWTAPEILRCELAVDLRSADVYSFGIIAHEIIYQRGPFYVSSKDLSKNLLPTETVPQTEADRMRVIVKILKNKFRPVIQPTVISSPGEETIMVILKEMMINCWKESPSQRWPLKKIDQAVKKTMADLKIVNVFSTMVERLEFYSKHLQEAVQQRADKVDQERMRIRQVLDQLFPGGIAKKLIDGERPKPVVYTNVCVYFNDIVGFTKICAANDASTVVKFLNILFTKYDGIIEMYNIHPVTRIGDAYMLVAGIPIELTGKDHASEIAQAALQIVEVVKSTEFKDVVFDAKDNHMKIRTGIASGGAVAGVVGQEIPSLCICGQSMTTALKMESKSKENEILVAQSTYDFLKEEFEFKADSQAIEVNNEIKVNGYWLNGKKGVTKMFINKRLDGKQSYKDKTKEAALNSYRV